MANSKNATSNLAAPSIAKVAEFQPFSNPHLVRITARWNNMFTISSIGNAVFAMTPDDARELIDALQKFVAAKAGR